MQLSLWPSVARLFSVRTIFSVKFVAKKRKYTFTVHTFISVVHDITADLLKAFFTFNMLLGFKTHA
jgi:hypothetical protein